MDDDDDDDDDESTEDGTSFSHIEEYIYNLFYNIEFELDVRVATEAAGQILLIHSSNVDVVYCDMVYGLDQSELYIRIM